MVLRRLLAILTGVWMSEGAAGSIIVTFSDPSGLAAEAEFSLLNATTLRIRLRNTSTGVPGGFGNSDQILTGLAWDFGDPGSNGDITITGGTVFTGPKSRSLNFNIQNVGPNEDVSGEWGYGNMDGTGLLTNFISATTAHATRFGGLNLDGPVNIDGPQGGLVADPLLIPLGGLAAIQDEVIPILSFSGGGLGAIQDEVIATLSLSGALMESELLADLIANGVRVEFGSDAAFIDGVVPAPGTIALLAIAGLLGRPRRRRDGS